MSNNLRTKIWGPPMWFSLACILMGYPEENPTKRQKKIYKQFLTILGDVLPCNLCRDSYKRYIKELKLDDYVMSSRYRLVMWLFDIHNKVNKKLGCKIFSENRMERKYDFFDKFRAKNCSKKASGCNTLVKKIKRKRSKVVLF